MLQSCVLLTFRLFAIDNVEIAACEVISNLKNDRAMKYLDNDHSAKMIK